jgi:hypothetical protein
MARQRANKRTEISVTRSITFSINEVYCYYYYKVAMNILNKQLRTGDKGWSFSLGVGRGAKKS